MDKSEIKALKDIEDYGCHILHIMGGNENPRFSYSIGIQRTTGQPEVVITGLKFELAHSLINEYNEKVQSGYTFEPNKLYDGFLDDFQVTFKKVEKEYFKEYFGWASWLYKNDEFEVLQLIYPSTFGVWPWDENAPEDYTWFLPKLYAN
jgi:hypothetical protein